jgi:hypothetical protein
MISSKRVVSDHRSIIGAVFGSYEMDVFEIFIQRRSQGTIASHTTTNDDR